MKELPTNNKNNKPDVKESKIKSSEDSEKEFNCSRCGIVHARRRCPAYGRVY